MMGSNVSKLIEDLHNWSDGPNTDTLCQEAAKELATLQEQVNELKEIIRKLKAEANKRRWNDGSKAK